MVVDFSNHTIEESGAAVTVAPLVDKLADASDSGAVWKLNGERLFGRESKYAL